MNEHPISAEDEPNATTSTAGVRIRRAPKYPVFLVFGGAIGAIVTIAVTSAFPTDPAVGLVATVGYFLLYGVPAGVALGGIVAIILDRVSSKRSTTLIAERTVVDAPDEVASEADSAEESAELENATSQPAAIDPAAEPAPRTEPDAAKG